MRRFILACALVVALGAGAASAANNFGVGIILGEPTGLSGKLWLTRSTAVDAAAAWSFGNEDAFHLHADYLVHNWSLFEVERGALGVHFGIGGRVKFEDDSRLGIRIPIGLTYVFDGAPVDIFVEVVPLLDVVPDTDFSPNGAIGVRYFFGKTTKY